MSYNDDQLRGVGGWLALLVIILGAFTPLRIVFNLVAIYTDPSIAAAFGPSWPAAQLLQWSVSAANLSLTLYLAWRLNSVHEPRTVRIVIAGLWIMALGITGVEFVAVSILLGIDIGSLVAEGAVDLVRGIVFCIVWTAYLLLSRRVANTYSEPEDDVAEVFA